MYYYWLVHLDQLFLWVSLRYDQYQTFFAHSLTCVAKARVFFGKDVKMTIVVDIPPHFLNKHFFFTQNTKKTTHSHMSISCICWWEVYQCFTSHLQLLLFDQKYKDKVRRTFLESVNIPTQIILNFRVEKYVMIKTKKLKKGPWTPLILKYFNK